MTLDRVAFRRGIADALPLYVPAVPFALVIGLAIVESGINVFAGWSGSWLIFGGAAQLTLVSLLGSGAAVVAAILAALVVNARHLMYSAALAPTYAPSAITRPFPFNAYYTLDDAPEIAAADWELEVAGLVQNTKARVSEVAGEARAAASKVGSHASAATKKTRKEALVLLDALREIIDPKQSTSTIEQLAETVIDTVLDWKDSAQDSLSQTLRTGKVESRRFVHKRTLLALSLAVGTGALIGYLASGSGDNE